MENKRHTNESVSKGRRYVESYVRFIHYVERLYLSMEGQEIHHGESRGAIHEGHHEH